MLYRIVSKIIEVENLKKKLPELEGKLQNDFSGLSESKTKRRISIT